MNYAPNHPAHAFKAFYCDSWLLDHQLADYLPSGSNIVRFLTDWYLLPVPDASDAQTMERVFGCSTADPLAETATSSLQRAVLTHIRQGGSWRNAAGVIFPEDLK